MQNHGIILPEKHIYTIGYPISEAKEGMALVLQKRRKGELPTAFLADNDLVAIGAMQAVKEFGYRIPEDFSFIGFADHEISKHVEPGLTTIHIPYERFGEEAVYQLIRQFEKKDSTTVKIEVNNRLVIRDSTKRI